LLAKVHPEKVF